jgi:hypothetical protein
MPGIAQPRLRGRVEQTGPNRFFERISTPSATSIKPQMLVGLATNYSPSDQKKVLQLYDDRSTILTDPLLDEDARQAALDVKDQQIAQVPKMPPIMQQPTPQEKFEASWVRNEDGELIGYIDNGEVKEFPEQKAKAEAEKDFFTYAKGELKSMQEAEADPIKNPSKETTSTAAKMVEIKANYNALKGQDDETRQMIPELAPTWAQVMDAAVRQHLTKGKKALSEQQMFEAMNHYQNAAVRQGFTRAQAVASFLQNWKSALGGTDMFKGKVPKMSDDADNMSRSAAIAASVGTELPDQQQRSVNLPPSTGTEQSPAQPTTQAEYDALPSGTIVQSPATGKLYRKP